MVKKRKTNKPKDRFEEIKEEILRGTGVMFEQTQHHIKLVAEQVAGNSEQINEIKEEISKLTEMVDMLRMDLKLKADNLELITLSRRIAVLEKKLVNRR
ncbi:MAG: hypothetical protein AAB780_01285 [Patescibacteria group bacterium]